MPFLLGAGGEPCLKSKALSQLFDKTLVEGTHGGIGRIGQNLPLQRLKLRYYELRRQRAGGV